tara:strand:+ start:5001 stop:5762 length:762 start_codon:yes stop_codon:yes gene_type:complete
MLSNKPTTRSAIIANYWQRNSSGGIPWQLYWKPVCASTEIDLSRWLSEKPLKGINPRAFISDRQVYGKGQRGRLWQSPKGGVWISAALPCNGYTNSVGLLGLAVAFTLAERLESKRISVQIKWPNDLLVSGKKLAGILPSLIYRGHSLKLARVGIGMNIVNKVPKDGISLATILGHSSCCTSDWAGEILLALDRVMNLFEQEELFYLEAQKRLWSKEVIDSTSGEVWEVEGLDINGGLKLQKDGKKKVWTRWQ